ncbi:MAG TPA: hypothetical protein ENG16_02940 [Archaeoglobus sp.]|nr:hypothetical protein [Archaeoglobus sp.]
MHGTSSGFSQGSCSSDGEIVKLSQNGGGYRDWIYRDLPNSYTDNFAFDVRFQVLNSGGSSGTGSGVALVDGASYYTNRSDGLLVHVIGANTYDQNAIVIFGGSSTTVDSRVASGWHTYSFLYSGGSLTVLWDGNEVGTATGTFSKPLSRICIGTDYTENASLSWPDFEVDRIVIRKYISPEPSISVGGEELAPGSW